MPALNIAMTDNTTVSDLRTIYLILLLRDFCECHCFRRGDSKIAEGHRGALIRLYLPSLSNLQEPYSPAETLSLDAGG
jgi:hypothetical protein